jgi:hypothetical protein
MLDLKKLLARDSRDARKEAAEADSDYAPSNPRGEALEDEYRSLIAAQCRRWGIDSGSITIEVRKLGHAHDGLDVLVAMIRLAKWERTSALRVLLGLPLLESKVRKSVRSSWLGELSHFGGLWLHASDKLHDTPAHHELRELLVHLAPANTAAPGSDGGVTADYGNSTAPPSTQGAPLASEPEQG